MNRTIKRVILLAITHYNNSMEICTFLNHVFDLTLPNDWRLEVAISDNSGTLNLTGSFQAGVTVYKPKNNLGYMPGCSYAFQRWVEERKIYPEWVGVANTDIEFAKDIFVVKQGSAFRALLYLLWI